MKKLQLVICISLLINGNLAIAKTTSKTTNSINYHSFCKKAINNLCPKETYRSKKEKLLCIETNFLALPTECQSNLTNNDTFEIQCSSEILKYCDIKKKKEEVVIKSIRKCRRNLRQKKHLLGSACRQELESENDSLIDAMFDKKSTNKDKNVSFNPITKNEVNNDRINDIVATKRNSLIKKEPDDIEEFKDNGYETGGNIILENGAIIKQSQMDRFNKKYQDIMNNMTEESQNQILYNYFKPKYNKISKEDLIKKSPSNGKKTNVINANTDTALQNENLFNDEKIREMKRKNKTKNGKEIIQENKD